MVVLCINLVVWVNKLGSLTYKFGSLMYKFGDTMKFLMLKVQKFGSFMYKFSDNRWLPRLLVYDSNLWLPRLPGVRF